jgi:hypothetical protein
MARLAEYMQKFAQLLGETRSVHFKAITKGSANLAAVVDFDATPKVNLRLREIRAGTAAEADLKTADEIDRMFVNDNTSGEVIRLKPNEVMLPFLGAKREKQLTYGPISQTTTLDGVVIRVGGKSEPVAVQIETNEGIQNYCYVTRDMAKELGKHLYGAELRFFGDGRWMRNGEGVWELARFSISRFEELDAASLGEVVAELRTMEGRDWTGVDPWKELREMRGPRGSKK